jgi:hypothetical protein
MTNRAANCVQGIVAGLLTGAAVATIQLSPAVAADECLTKPREATPAGKHWFYRSDRATKRQCWYLRDDDAPSQGASLAPRRSAAAKRPTDFTESAANARAELQGSAAAADAKPAAQIAPATPAPAVTPPPAAQDIASTQPAPAQDTFATTPSAVTSSAVASRWPDPSAAVSSSAEPSNGATPFAVASAESGSTATASTTESANADTPTPTAMAVASTPVNDVDVSASLAAAPRADDPDRTQLIALLGAIAIAGFSTSVLFARARARRQIQLEPVGARRGVQWPAEPELDRMRLAPIKDQYPALMQHGEDEPRRTPRLSVVQRDHARYDEQFEVEDLLSRYAVPSRDAMRPRADR